MVGVLFAKAMLKLGIVLFKSKKSKVAAMTGVTLISSAQEIKRHKDREKYSKKQDYDESIFDEQNE